MEHVFDARAMIQIGEVQSINDTGQAQTATVKAAGGAVYGDIEVVQSYGMASNAPPDGALALLFCVGGDPANMRAIVFNPSYRFGTQASGEMTIFAPDGTRVSVRTGGIIDIKGGNQINIAAPNAVINASAAVAITAPTVTITGNLVVNSGSITNNGTPLTVP